MSKKVYLDNNEEMLFYYPMDKNNIPDAIEYIQNYGLESYLEVTNLRYYVPSLFPFSKSHVEVLSNKQPAQIYEELEKLIQNSILIWHNRTIYNLNFNSLDSILSQYKIDQYGLDFMMGDYNKLQDDAIIFPLTEEELYLVKDIIDNKGAAFFVEHCKKLPECIYVKDTEEETIKEFTTLIKNFGSAWLLGQLNNAAILNIKDNNL